MKPQQEEPRGATGDGREVRWALPGSRGAAEGKPPIF